MNYKKLGCLGVIFGVAAVGYSMYVNAKMQKLSNKIGESIDKMSKDIDVNVPDILVEKAVEKAVDREVGRTVNYATSQLTKDIRSDIRKEVKETVQSIYSDIKRDVVKEVERQVGNIDISSVRKEVVEKGKQAALEKLNNSLDEILDKFNQDLHNVSKIYESIANRMSKDNNEKEMVFKIS